MIATEKCGLMDDVHPEVAQRFAEEALNPVLDMGCGEGRFINADHTYDLHTITLDQSGTMLAAISTPRTNGDARQLPFHDGCFGGVSNPLDALSSA